MKSIFFLAIVISVFVSCDKDDEQRLPTVIAASGDVQDEIDVFKQLLGDPLNTSPGASGGRREIDWEGVPDELMGTELPADFFNPTDPGAPATRQRGLAYVSNGQFRVSNSGFSDINQSAATQLTAFSGNKIFANVAANDWEIEFEVPGQNVGASVRGFGAVFTDVDRDSTVSLEFFKGNKSIGKYYVPKRQELSSHSFLAVYFSNGEIITRIRVHHEGRLIENSVDVSNGGTEDLIALDNFFYDEPAVR